MRKLLFFLSLASASLLTGCDNDNSVNPQPLGTAKISGTVYADFDLTNNAPIKTWDKVANKKLVIEVYDDYSNSTRYLESTTDANGNYTVEFEIGNRELYVTIVPVDFKANVKKAADLTEEEIFYGEAFNGGNAEIVKGGELIRDLEY